jgi:hypothetical protein
MEKKILILQILLIGLIAYVLYSLPDTTKPSTSTTVIEKRIAGKETVIKQQGKAIDNSKVIIEELNHGLFDLQAELEKVKNSRDTFKITQIQDTMIHVLYRRDKEKDAIIAAQDTIIVAQRYIINSQDTIITSQAFDIKKLKRQRNISFILNGILTTGLIIK